MNKRKNGAFVRKCRTFLTAAIMSTVLVAGQSGLTTIYASTATESVGALIPDSLTVSSPCSLSEISLPSNEYGRLVWEDDSRTADEGEHSFTVLIKPASGVDLSGMSGWDEGQKAVVRSITVIVSGSGDEESEDESEPEEEDTEETESSEDGEEEEDDADESDEDAEDEDDVEEEADDTDDGEEEAADESDDSDDEDAGSEDVEDEDNADDEDADAEDDIEDDADDEDADDEDGEDADDEDADDEDADDEDADDEDADEEDEGDEDTDGEIIGVVPEGVDDQGNIFDQGKVISNTVSDKAFEEKTTDAEKEAEGLSNHASNGIMVSGANLPYYVQFRVSDGSGASFSNQENADIFRSYEFSLWDLKNDKKYEIPDGEYVSLAIPVKAGYTYTVEHILDNGAKEMITPSVSGNLLTFSTHSFSPFGIAGSRTIVGEEVENENYNSGSSGSSSSGSSSSGGSTSSGTRTSSGSGSTGTAGTSTGSGSTAVRNTSGTVVSAGNSSSSNTNTTVSTGNNTNTNRDYTNRTYTTRPVTTGDDTNILPFVGLIAAALIVILLVVFLKKRNK